MNFIERLLQTRLDIPQLVVKAKRIYREYQGSQGVNRLWNGFLNKKNEPERKIDIMEDEKKISLLNDLLTKNYDAEKGYKEAADKAYDPNLKRFCKIHADQRYKFGHELKGEITALGGSPDKGSSLAGDVHRMWINMKVPMSDNVDRSITHECIRGEEQALDDYQEVKEKLEFPINTVRILDDHIFKIKEAKNSLEELMLTYKKTQKEKSST